MKRIVVYGNCQAGPIGRLIERATTGFEVVRVPPVHTILSTEILEIENLFRSADIVLGQPIGANWGRLGSESLKSFFEGSSWIEFPSIYFGGLFPYLQYARNGVGGVFRGPLGDYHDKRILKSFINGSSELECLVDLLKLNENYCKSHFIKSLNESRDRERNLQIQIMPYIEKHLTETRTLYTFNHPTNAVLWNIVIQFLDLIGTQSIIDGPPKNPFLDEVSAAIPIELTHVAGVVFSDNTYTFNRVAVRWEILISQFYQSYSQIPGFRKIIEDSNDFALEAANAN